ncbi:MAG: hypothetical protein HYR57_10015, partial [Candidatus Koribacter versatilis]|nr:hypothetical protein [Candidatus Koribacter versatilis]
MLKKVLVSLCLAAVGTAQTKTAPPAKPAAATPAAAPGNALPSEDTVNAFMFQMVGYNPTVTWRVAEIRPTQIAGLTEVLVVITDPQGS